MATIKRTASQPAAGDPRSAKPKASKPRKLESNQLVEPTVPELLPDIEGAASNLLPFSATRLPLRVEFPMWANSYPSDQYPEFLKLYWNGTQVSGKTWTDPVKPEELHIMVPTSFLRHGEHVLHYDVTLFNDSGASSRPLTIHIDREAPELIEGQDSLLFDQEILRNGITEDYLEAYSDKVEAKIPPYLGAEPGDTLKWYFSDDPAGRQMAGMHVLDKDDIKRLSAGNSEASKAPYTVVFHGDFIRQTGDGIRFARYEIQDRAGTAVQRSLAQSINSKASPPPRVLVPPFIREATGSDYFSTLLPADASKGVIFVIPEDADLRPGETATIYWGTPDTVGAYQTSTPITPGSREYQVPKAYIAPHTNSQVELYYQINKPDVPRSPSHQVTVREITGLPYVQCAKLKDGKLNLGSMGTRADFTLDGWPFRDTSQFVRASIEGVDRNNLSLIITLDIAVDLPVPTEAGIMQLGSVDKAEFERLALNDQFQVSPSYQVTVRAITGLPYMQCVKLQDGKLNLGSMGAGADFTLDGWPFRDTSQFVRAWIEGVDRNDLSLIIKLDIAVDLPVPTEAGIMQLGSVDKAEFERLALNYQFQVSVQVSFDNKASWLKFPGIAATLVDE